VSRTVLGPTLKSTQWAPGALSGDEVTGAWSWPLASIWCWRKRRWRYTSTTSWDGMSVVLSSKSLESLWKIKHSHNTWKSKISIPTLWWVIPVVFIQY